MIRQCLKITVRYSFLPFNLFNADHIDKSTSTVQTLTPEEIKVETGWDRVLKIFEVDEFGGVSDELNSIMHVSLLSILVGSVYGGVNASKAAYNDFMRNNQATKFETHLDAKRKLQDKVTTEFAKGAFKWSWRLTLFSSTFLGVTTIVSTYRDKVSLTDYILAGTTSGFLYKFNMGPRGWLVGGGLGAVLGLMCGGTSLTLLHLTGMSMKETRYWQTYWITQRNEVYNKGLAKRMEDENSAIMKLHDMEVGEKGKDINNV